MLVVVYRWTVEPGREQQFVEGWQRVTRAIRARCGSYGSRLHRCDDGTWLGYARWPDAATRERCEHGETEGLRMMAETTQHLEQLTAEIVSDLLAEPTDPRPPSPARST